MWPRSARSARNTVLALTPSTAARSRGGRQPLPRARLAVGDRPAEGRGDLLVQRNRAQRVDLHDRLSASYIRIITRPRAGGARPWAWGRRVARPPASAQPDDYPPRPASRRIRLPTAGTSRSATAPPVTGIRAPPDPPAGAADHRLPRTCTSGATWAARWRGRRTCSGGEGALRRLLHILWAHLPRKSARPVPS